MEGDPYLDDPKLAELDDLPEWNALDRSDIDADIDRLQQRPQSTDDDADGSITNQLLKHEATM